MPACVLFVGDGNLRRAVSSAPYSPAADDARRNTHRVPGPVQLRLATLNPAVSFAVVGGYESVPVGVVTAPLSREARLCSCGSASAPSRRLTATYPADLPVVPLPCPKPQLADVHNPPST